MKNLTRKFPYYVVNVFTDEKFKGNPLAVVIINEELNESDYKNIAHEFGYAETSFIQYFPKIEVLKVRSFTPGGFEVSGAGHNLLGVICLAFVQFPEIAAVLQKNEVVTMKDDLIPLSIRFKENNLPFIGMLQQPAQVIGSIPVENIIAGLNLQKDDMDTKYFEPQIVRTEVIHLMIPVKNKESLNRAVPDIALLSSLAESYNFEGCYLFFTNQATGIVETRFFNPRMGIHEDGGTGSAAGPLGGMFNLHGHLKKGEDLNIQQGEKMQQPSKIFVSVEDNGVWVKGSSVLMMEGYLYL